VQEDESFSALNLVVRTRTGFLATKFEGNKEEKLVKGEFWGFCRFVVEDFFLVSYAAAVSKKKNLNNVSASSTRIT